MLNSKLSIKKLFLIDAIGALVSAILLGVVLVALQHLVGLPKNMLYLLSAIPILFFTNSLRCYKFDPTAAALNLKLVAIFNLLYCCLTASLIVIYFNDLTTLGIIYFSGEIILVVALSIFELQFASKHKQV